MTEILYREEVAAKVERPLSTLRFWRHVGKGAPSRSSSAAASSTSSKTSSNGSRPNTTTTPQAIGSCGRPAH